MVMPPVVPLVPVAEVIITYAIYLFMGFIVANGIKDDINSKLQRERLNLRGEQSHAIVQSREKLREDFPKGNPAILNCQDGQ